ncbi:DUF5052 family protein [Staphylococcus gallinarum]|uniref:DUF5052 family protein n=1 Tax=Staphylococcus gallinarum TaxID=1293 RepID=UPI001E350E7B|nr:DUF5052 family protein [Staphylococcus gallinarum]MCD8921683.1 DUF5052 family protein [Staphylococcus gallinarum]
MKKLVLAATLLLTVFLGGCTWLDDEIKDHKSDTKGLERTVIVYSKTGDVVKKYKGNKVRTKYNDGGALVINIDGKRVQVMNSDVVIEEKGAEKYEVSK